jgi:hypothetical protein
MIMAASEAGARASPWKKAVLKAATPTSPTAAVLPHAALGGTG